MEACQLFARIILKENHFIDIVSLIFLSQNCEIDVESSYSVAVKNKQSLPGQLKLSFLNLL